MRHPGHSVSRQEFQLERFIRSLSSTGHFGKIGISATHIKDWKTQLRDNQKIIDELQSKMNSN